MIADLHIPYRSVATGAALVAWLLVRAVISALLVIFEPIARVVLSALAIVSLAMAFLFEFATQTPDFPFWGMLGVSLASLWLLATYYALMQCFGR